MFANEMNTFTEYVICIHIIICYKFLRKKVGNNYMCASMPARVRIYIDFGINCFSKLKIIVFGWKFV